MFGQRLWILILDLLFLVLTSIMTVMALHASWSDHAGKPEEPLLISALAAAGLLYIIRSFTHKTKDKTLFSIKKKPWKKILKKEWNIPIKVRLINRLAGLSFFFIAMFAVWNHKAPHFVFTALAILFAHLEIWTFYKKSLQRSIWRAVSLLGLFGFAGGFFFHWYSIGWGESFVALPAILFVIRHEIVTLTHKKKK